MTQPWGNGGEQGEGGGGASCGQRIHRWRPDLKANIHTNCDMKILSTKPCDAPVGQTVGAAATQRVEEGGRYRTRRPPPPPPLTSWRPLTC